jgi:hypothetical protein
MKTSTIKIYKTHNSVSCIERGFDNITNKKYHAQEIQPPQTTGKRRA